MLIDCDACELRGLACDDCVVTALLGTPAHVEVDDEEQQALRTLAEGGMVSPLRLVERSTGAPAGDTRGGGRQSGAA